MSAPLAHVGGVPVEEALLAFAPLAAVWVGVARASLRRRRPPDGSALIEDVSDAQQHDDGPAISYQALRRGTRVRASDGTDVGTVQRVLDNVRENIFDGLVVETRDGSRFVDAPEVARVAERAVTLSITADEVARLDPAPSRLRERFDRSPLVRRLRRRMRDR